MRRTSLALVALGAGAAAGYWFGWRQPRLTLPTPRPARDYPAALAQAATLTALDAGPLIPVCRTQIFDHGRRTPGAVVLFHGFTNCPAQFAALGEAFFRQGDNVVIVRLPRHGLEHRYVDELKQLTAEELLAAASAAVDVAAGLGERVTVLGLSLGGLLAGWQAQLRGDVDRAVLVAPALRFFTVPGRWQPFYARVLSWWPSFFYWWDPVAKTQGGGVGPRLPRLLQRGLCPGAPAGAALAEGGAPTTAPRPAGDPRHQPVRRGGGQSRRRGAGGSLAPPRRGRHRARLPCGLGPAPRSDRPGAAHAADCTGLSPPAGVGCRLTADCAAKVTNYAKAGYSHTMWLAIVGTLTGASTMPL